MKSEATREQLQRILSKLIQFKVTLFLLLVGIVYIYVIWQVDTLSKAQPSATTIALQSHTSASPNIDPATVDKIQQLQNNSVSVQALFNQARANPFQE